MVNPVELFVGLRYLRAKRRTKFVSFISLISLLGIALGVAALIVILSVMNGFEAELRGRLLSMTAHGSVTADGRRLSDWQEVAAQINDNDRIVAVAPVIELEGMIRAGRSLTAVQVNGVLPEYEQSLDSDSQFLEGSLDVLQPGSRSIALGRILALEIGARIGDGVVLLIPQPNAKGELQPVLERFVLRAVFEAGVQEHDSSLAFLHLSDAARLARLGSNVSAVRFLADDVMAAPQISASLSDGIAADLRVTDWTVENASYFNAIKLEKLMMTILLSLIIGVAAFNIVASLVMVVTDKNTDIAILRTLGMGPRGVVRVFFIQGAMIGWIGVILGVALGVVVAFNVPTLAPWLENLLGFQIMPGDVYYVTRIPSVVDAQNVGLIALGAFLLTSFATLYPARRAALVDPAVALRYE